MKLGTITPHGADVYSYAPDEDDMVEDPNLAEHLAHWRAGPRGGMESRSLARSPLGIPLRLGPPATG